MKKYTNFIIAIFFILAAPQLLLAEGDSNDPEVTITSTISTNEGDSGTKKVHFTISINECPDTSPIVLKYTTTNGSASQNEDYIKTNGTIQFDTPSYFGMLNCTQSYTKSVTIKGDTDVEPNETFYIQLSDNGTSSYQKYHYGNQRSTITIKNDDVAETPKSADLSITKSNDKSSTVAIGDTITYTIVGKNNGPDSSKIYIWDTMPDDLTFISVSDNRSNFNCNYNSSDRKVRCRGDRVFNKNDSVTITVKAKVTANDSDTITNYAGIQSGNSPKINDPDTSNNKAQSSIGSQSADLGVKKLVRKGNSGKFKTATSCNLNDIVTFKITLGNYGTSAARIYLEDKVPSYFTIQSISTDNKPSNYNCSINSNKVTCSGSHKFSNNEEMTLYIKAKAIKRGRVYNKAQVSSPDGIREEDPKDNKSYARVNIGLSGIGMPTGSKVPSAPDSDGYTVGDIITYTITGTNHGEATRVDISDWLNKNKFEFISVENDDSHSVTLNCTTRNSTRSFAMYCASSEKVLDNQSYGIKVKVKLKKSGNICNSALYYKYINGWIYRRTIKNCINVSEPKAKPILDADIFYIKLNKADSIDLQDYTTDDDTPKDQLTYKLLSSLPSGLTMTNDGLISGTYTDSSGTFPKDFNVTVSVTDPDGLSSSDSFTIRVEASDITANDNYYKIPINSTLNGNLITDSASGGDHPFNADTGVNLTLISVNPNSNIQWNSNGSFTYTAPNHSVTTRYTYIIKDKYGQTDSAFLRIKVYKPKIDAKNDVLEVAKNTPLSVNVFSDNGNGIDVGDDINVTSYTQPSHGTLYIQNNGKLTYTPDTDYVGSDSATYTITDKYGQTDSANISFKVGAIHHEGYINFYLVNPPRSRNLIGNYVTIGNTVECITEKKGTLLESNSFNGTCQNDSSLSNNDYMVRYIDTDGSNGIGAGTWNSSSATFTLPDSFLKINGGKGIAWAGLFWQGSLNVKFGFKQRYAFFQNASTFNYKPIIQNMTIDLSLTGADRVLMRIDNSASYQEVTADTFYNDLAHGIFGGYYAAYANVTSLLQQAQLSKGDHTITVANIMTNEGREANIGNYGGWSLVIIYREDMTGKPRNISIYNGYQPIGKGGSTNIPRKELIISGFKLPKSGSVESSISAFVGEGEMKYGGTDIVYDKMYIKDPNDNNKTYDMPARDPKNIFDASIDNIVRHSGVNNDINNTNGIDVDTYNVSSIMQKIRDNKINTNQVVIGIVSKDEDKSDGDDSDYITASMLGFSTELYAPKVCYDYNVRLGQNINIPSENREFKVTEFANEPLQLKLMLRSQEADFDLIDSKLSAKFTPVGTFSYKPGASKYSPPNTYAYLDAIETNTTGEIAIGRDPTQDGGTIGAKETTYAKLYYNFLKPSFDGKFDILLNAQISFDGITKVPYTLSTEFGSDSVFSISRCNINPVYNPVYGNFNVERGDSDFISQDEAHRYALYTQVTGVPYSISLASYTKNSNGKFTKASPSNATVEVELIDGGTFDNNSSAGYDSVCDDPDTYSLYGKGTFVHFNNKKRVTIKIPDDYPTYPQDLALKNAVFRTWVLTQDINGTNYIVNHNCQDQNDSSCFETIYNNTYKDSQDKDTKFCLDKCKNSSGTKCYDCLREHFAKPICSRDNFAIRPNSYSIVLQDSNQTNNGGTSENNISINNSSVPADISAGYLYKFAINATQYAKRDKAKGYYFIPDSNSSLKKALALFSGAATCTDRNDTQLNISLLDGETKVYENNTSYLPENGFIINNTGRYRIHIEDREWTKVDHKGYQYKPFPQIGDCDDNSSNPFNGQINAKRGCVTQTDGALNTYPDLIVKLHPYKFKLDSIVLNSNPNNTSNYIYMNDLNKTNLLIKDGSVMAIKLAGGITALGKNGKTLSNYVDGCDAQNLNLKLNYNKTPDINDSFGNKPILNYAFYDSVVDSNSTPTIYQDNNGTVINSIFNKRYFYTPSIGSFNNYFNIAREYNNPINPFKLHFGEISVASPNDKMNVDMQSNYIPKGKKDINNTKILYYAKIKSTSEFYDDIYEDNVTTPIYVSIFCNKSLSYCANYGIDTSKAMTSEFDWWLSLNHDASKEGKAYLKVDSAHMLKASIAPNPVTSFTNGIDKNVVVKSLDRTPNHLPYTIKIEPTSLMEYLYPWLLYNKFNNTVPDYIYKVRFVNPPADWSGSGSTGHTIDTNSTGRRTKKVDW